jgi:D-serine deaminase-like pyridoxal phosphate-dependent protein
MFEFEIEQDKARVAQLTSAQEHISLYGVFVTDTRAQRLLALWKQQSRVQLPIDAPIQAYAAKEFARRFIDIIEANIEQARRGQVSALLDQEHLR